MRSFLRRLVLTLAWLAAVGAQPCFAQVFSDLTPTELRCEWTKKPIGIDTPHPRFSWTEIAPAEASRNQAQTAYQILVASSSDLLRKEKGDIWDSGKISAAQSSNVHFEGTALKSNTVYYWKVRIYDQSGRVSQWSDVGSWATGLLADSPWSAKWITWQPTPAVGQAPDPHGSVSPWLRKSFSLSRVPTTAFLHLNVVGYAELYVNGSKVSADPLTPALSSYRARNFYVTYDIAPFLHAGENAIGVWLGRGWYDPETMNKDPERGPGPRVRLQCELSEDSRSHLLVSDSSWKAAASPYTTIGLYEWCEFNGEQYDARLESPAWAEARYDDHSWQPARETKAPSPLTESQPCPPNRRSDHFSPKKITALGGNRYELDFGTNLSGGFKLRLPAMPRDTVVTLHYADARREKASDAGLVVEGTRTDVAGSFRELAITDPQGAVHAYQSMRQYDKFISAGRAADFETKFNYHGFRYVIVENLATAPRPEDATATLIESDLESVGSFACSNELFNRIHATNRWTLRCLDLGGYLADCPHRERVGYGDHQVSIETCVTNFWMPSFYEKWITDWRDVQTASGNLPNSAPQGIGGGGPAWAGTLLPLVWKTYLYYGDIGVLEKNYAACRRLADAMEKMAKQNILRSPGGRWDFVGDHVAPGRGMDSPFFPPADPRPAELFNNCYRVITWSQLGQIAQALNKTDEAQFCEAKVAAIRPAIHQEFYDAAKARYLSGEQINALMPLVAGVVPHELAPTIFQHLEDNLLKEKNGHLDTGMWGTYFLLRYLQSTGRSDLVFTLMNQETYPSWGYMLAQGATTFWEQWNGFYSRIHSCFTSPGGWFYQGLAGIQASESAPGFKHIEIKPSVVGDLTWVRASQKTAYGLVSSAWSWADGRLTLSVVVPPNATATIFVPTSDESSIQESDLLLSEHREIKRGKSERGLVAVSVGSGHYEFKSELRR